MNNMSSNGKELQDDHSELILDSEHSLSHLFEVADDTNLEPLYHANNFGPSSSSNLQFSPSSWGSVSDSLQKIPSKNQDSLKTIIEETESQISLSGNTFDSYTPVTQSDSSSVNAHAAQTVHTQGEVSVKHPQLSVPDQDQQSIGISLTSISAAQSLELVSEKKTIFDSGDTNLLRLLIALRRTGPVAKALARIYDCLSGRPTNVTLLDHCIHTLSHETVQKVFSSREQQELNVSTCSEFDITLLYKLLQHGRFLSIAGDAKWVRPSDTIEYHLYKVKSYRNFLAHTAVSLSDQELEDVIYDLKRLLSRIFTLVGRRTNKSRQIIHEFIQDADRSLNNILSAAPPSEWSPKYEKDLQIIRDQLLTKTIEDAQEELRILYSSLKVVSPVTWVFNPEHRNITIDKVYTDVEIILEENEFSNGAKEEKLKTRAVKDILLNSVYQASTAPVRILEGISGSGKTSLCRYLIYCWTEGSSEIAEIENIDILILIQCRFVRSTCITNFLKDDALQNTLKTVPSEDVASVLRGGRIMFLVDGFDEGTSQVKGMLLDLRTKFPNSHLFITTRPDSVLEVQALFAASPLVNEFIMLKIVGFHRDQINSYTEKLFKCLNKGERQKIEFLSFLHSKKENLGPLTEIPMTLAIIALLWLDDNKKLNAATSSTELHLLLIDMIVKKIIERIETMAASSGQQISGELESACWKWVICLGEVAWKALRVKKHCITKEDKEELQERSKSLCIKHSELLSAFLQCESKVSLTDHNVAWSFPATSQQEMLAALHLAEEVMLHKKLLHDALEIKQNIGSKNLMVSLMSKLRLRDKLEIDYEEIKHLSNVIVYVIGILLHNKKLTLQVAREVGECFSAISPRSIEIIATLLRESRGNKCLKQGLKSGLSGKTFPSDLRLYNMSLAVELLLNEVLSLPKIVSLIANYVPNLVQVLNFLLSKSCKCNVEFIVDNREHLDKLVKTLQKVDDPVRVDFTLNFGYYEEDLDELVKNWHWPKPVFLTSCLEHCICFAYMFLVKSMSNYHYMPKSLEYTGSRTWAGIIDNFNKQLVVPAHFTYSHNSDFWELRIYVSKKCQPLKNKIRHKK